MQWGCSDLIVLTSSLAALLHAVLVNVQCEQHVGVASLFLICSGPAGAACGDGRIQVEGSFLSRRGSQLTLILELRGEEETEIRGWGEQKRPHRV